MQALAAVPRGLSSRLLALTIAFMMASMVLIFVPSLSRFRLNFLNDRIDAANLAIFALEASPGNVVSQELAAQLLAHVGAYGIVVHKANMTLMLTADNPPPIDATYDLRGAGMAMPLADALETLGEQHDRVLRVLAESPKDPGIVVELILDERPLRQGMWRFAGRVLGISSLIALITGVLLYVSLRRLLVTPLRRLTANMMRFRDDPEDAARVIAPEPRGDEIGLAQRELASMQETVRQALRQKERLAALGTAVTKINHDLRNILSTARLVSDGLMGSAVPEVRRVTPRLIEAIDRAVALCERTLSFTGDAAPAPVRRRFALADLVAEVAEHVPRPGPESFVLANEVPPLLMLTADRDQLFRVLQNLVLNAAQAGARRVALRARALAGDVEIEVADDGPGLAPKARENLFRPFAGSARPGGNGLGLAIAREVMRAHGGDIVLVESTGAGTIFVLRLPGSLADTRNVIAIARHRREQA